VTPTTGGGGAATPELDALAPFFPAYELEEFIGRGGMGAVYRARHRKLDRPVALKILTSPDPTDPTFAERFAREARALARLDHAGIVGVHDFGEVGGFYFLVMDYVDGANLREVLRGGPMSRNDVLSIIPQLCDALQYAHENGVVHRDIKPENILLDQEGRVRIADFGLAMVATGEFPGVSLTASGHTLGTPHYMAPEQVAGGGVDHRADLYALGVVLYEMLTGSLPLGRFDSPSSRTGTDTRLDPVVMKALEADPAGRYQHATELRDAVSGTQRLRPTREDEASTEPQRQLPPWVGYALPAALGLATIVLPWIESPQHFYGWEVTVETVWFPWAVPTWLLALVPLVVCGVRWLRASGYSIPRAPTGLLLGWACLLIGNFALAALWTPAHASAQFGLGGVVLFGVLAWLAFSSIKSWYLERRGSVEEREKARRLRLAQQRRRTTSQKRKVRTRAGGASRRRRGERTAP